MFAGIYGQSIPSAVSLADFAYAFSPVVEETARDTVVIDVEGCELLFGSPYELGQDIVRTAAMDSTPGGLGCKVNVAIAANPDAAIHAARFCEGITFTAPGEELTCLGALPIKCIQHSLVGLEEKRALEIIETLKLWGVHTFRDFAELPVAGVSERLGQDGLKLQLLAAGKTDRHLKIKTASPVFTNSIDLEYPITELEPLSFIFARLLNQICASLNAYALATNLIQVKLKLERDESHELKLNLPYPMRDHKVFLKLLLLETEAHPPPTAVAAVAINCEPVKPRLLQSGLFIPLAPEPEKLELTLARLGKLVGAENIGAAELLDTHRPDAFRMKRFVLKEEKRGKGQRVKGKRQTANSKQQTADNSADPKFVLSNPQSAIRNPKSVLGFRMFRPALRALVQTQRGFPTEISAWDKTRSVYGKVVGMAGPWRTTGDWWRTDMWARDEWDVAIQSTVASVQTLYRIYREARSGVWFVEGIYD
jgi:protein ImuB